MSLWVDKYRPHSLAKVELHPEITNRLRCLAQCDDLPHLLVYGPSGAGKKTRVMALLRELYGAGAEKVKLEHRSLKTASNKTIEVTTLGSNYHIECNPSDAGNNDRFVVQEVIKEIASHGALQASSNVGGASAKAFKVVILNEADRLSRQAQASLRRTMEKYSAQCRIILVCTSPSKIIDPVRSRCLPLRVPAPELQDIATIISAVAAKENIACPSELATAIAAQCDRNLRRALLMLEASHVGQSPTIQLPDWEVYLQRVAKEILQEQSPTKLLAVRDMLYELLCNCIPADVIITRLSAELMKSIDDQLKHEVVFWAAYYEHRLQLGSKDIFHLEAFVAKFMAIYKRWIVSLFC